MPLLICPHCHVEMKEVKTFDVLIDVCTQCSGIWLDQGELLKLVKEALNHEKSEDNKFSVSDILKQVCQI